MFIALLKALIIEIQFMFFKASISQIPLLSNLLLNAIQNSQQWKKKREMRESTTDCLTTMIPKDSD